MDNNRAKIKLMEANGPPNEFEFVDLGTTLVRVPDSNNLNYSVGEIQFQGSQIVTANSFADIRNSTFRFPITHTSTFTGGLEPVNTDEIHCLKNALAIISGVKVSAGNATILNAQALDTLPWQWKKVTSITQLEEDVEGPTIFFAHETIPDQWNSVMGAVNGDTSTTKRSAGITKRCKMVEDVSDVDATGYISSSSATFKTNRVPFRQVTTSGVDDTMVTTIKDQYIVVLKAEHINNFFQQMGFTRGTLWDINFYSQLPAEFKAAGTITVTSDELSSMTVTSASSTVKQGFMPFNLAPLGNVYYEAGTDGTRAFTITSTLSIGNDYLKSCEWIVPMIALNPGVESQFISSPKKRVVFQDSLTFQPKSLKNIEAGQTVDEQITPGVAKPRGMLVIPVLSALESGGNAVFTQSPLLSPFSTQGLTGLPYGPAAFQNVNIRISSAQVYPTPLNTIYDLYEELSRPFNKVNANMHAGMVAGLVSIIDFLKLYPHMYFDLTKHAPSTDDIPKSIDLTFTYQGAKKCDLIVYIFTEKSITFDVVTGEVSQ